MPISQGISRFRNLGSTQEPLQFIIGRLYLVDITESQDVDSLTKVCSQIWSNHPEVLSL